MSKPYLVSTHKHTATTFDVVIHHTDQREAGEYARNYFGDSRGDYRNRNRVEYLHSDVEGNHTYRVHQG